ncbi:hypothetical protein DAI22_12g069025 [Oryza sativa Japonica Group]|nr:hypothetical protein DAI22_12g069025 [Oryza sativa Japonica Group]
MTKAIPKIGSRRKVRIGLCRNARFSLRKSARRITKGVIHVQANPQGRVVFWSSAGTCGFKSSRKASPYAGQRTAVDAIRTGAGSGRDAALRAIAKSGVQFSCIRDVTPMPHNGCRPPKKRRL